MENIVDVKKVIYNLLREGGCEIEEFDGITFVVTKDKKMWGFTEPLDESKQKHAHYIIDWWNEVKEKIDNKKA